MAKEIEKASGIVIFLVTTHKIESYYGKEKEKAGMYFLRIGIFFVTK